MTTFKELGISNPIMKALERMGFEEATPIQAETIPVALEGNDVIGQAQTGTGKTAAFGIPMIEKLDPKARKIQGLVVAPTRELAIQVAEELNRLGKIKKVRAFAVYGGQHMERQIRSLKDGPQIVVATPGRLLDHMRRKTIRTNHIQTTVLDEADEMLNMGFIDDIREILKAIPEERQTLLFSATMPKEIRDIATNLMNNPKEIKIKAKEMTVENIDQYFIEIPEKFKFDTLNNHLDIHSPDLAIVFSRTKKRVDEITEGLQARGYRAEGIHGDLTQGKRMSVLNKFKNGRVDVLVATDVAARGLDISGVTHVYNFDIPQDPESYVHRIGRTGRAGRTGEAISFITPRELAHLQLIEKVTKSKMKRLTPPTNRDARKGQQQVTISKIMETIESKDLNAYHQAANQLLEDHDSVSVISAALKLLTKERKDTPVKISSVAPVSVKKANNVKDNRRSNNKRFYGKRGQNNRGGQSGRNRKGNFQKRRNRDN
ncbi:MULTISPECIES: DEAD/DEAH box helicase [Virgibacillus]|uniref:ATP-dependent RNA helicase CshA n=1 Tax=Virgibacillus pantothenticus TaxID=1473 RepID=A0A0L0QSZ8_VIRPA|nr:MULTISPECIES: DEAD/DEAH box helicase [Virgibacillus]API91658.1 DEAD/DEAH box helicase [Virgibacillus sp. 6R]KNE21679.1 DEAD/DEAH box helicase [Virgibacillus pantothenticus]MEB5453738.1 DEAD/DEAH box helicase [Virgibacillus pantothenticus]MEB5458002.1 DEAD/DEAH box helicase [Virgibacillus pantothenticus]MEB5462158.1 DEAD/DEAH box helicase [Virgibacillus pantothenticus]